MSLFSIRLNPLSSCQDPRGNNLVSAIPDVCVKSGEHFLASSACINEIISLNIGIEFGFIYAAALTRKLPWYKIDLENPISGNTKWRPWLWYFETKIKPLKIGMEYERDPYIMDVFYN